MKMNQSKNDETFYQLACQLTLCPELRDLFLLLVAAGELHLLIFCMNTVSFSVSLFGYYLIYLTPFQMHVRSGKVPIAVCLELARLIRGGLLL